MLVKYKKGLEYRHKVGYSYTILEFVDGELKRGAIQFDSFKILNSTKYKQLRVLNSETYNEEIEQMAISTYTEINHPQLKTAQNRFIYKIRLLLHFFVGC